MLKIYNPLGARTTAPHQNSEHDACQRVTHHKKRFLKAWSSLLMYIVLLSGMFVANAQSTANYAFTTNTTSSLAADANANAVDMTVGTTPLVASSLDDVASSVTNIGFNFVFMGVTYTQFSANSNGLLALGSVAVATNGYTINGGTTATPRFAAFNADLLTGTNGKVHFKIVGAAPNRTLVVEYSNMQLFFTSTAGAGLATYQIRLYETNGRIEYVYGAMSVSDISATNKAPSIGFCFGAATNQFVSINYSTSAASTTAPFVANPAVAATGAIANLDSASNGSRRAYVFTPAPCGNAPVDQATGLILTPAATSISGTFANAAGSPDGYLVVRYPQGAVVTNPVDGTIYPVNATLGLGTVVQTSIVPSFNATGLTTGVAYDFYVYALAGAICPGYKYNTASALTGTSTATFAVFTATAQGGFWSAAATWAGGTVPPASNDISIPAGSIVVVDQVTNYRNLDISGTVQWNSTSNAMTLTGSLTVNASGRFLPYTPGGTGQTVNIGGDFTNNGFANFAFGSSNLVFNGAGSTLSGSGTFLGDDANNGIIRQLNFSNLGSNTITTSQNLIVTFALTHAAGTLNTNGKLILDNTAQVYGQPTVNTGVQSIAVTNAGSLYSVAPVVFGQAVVQYASGLSAGLATRYVSDNNVYLCVGAGTFNTTPPTTTDLQATFTTSGPTLLYIGTVGTLGTNIPFGGTLSLTTQYFHGDNVYQSLVTAAVTSAVNLPVHTSGVVNNFLYLGAVAKATVAYDAVSQTVRNLTLLQNGSGFTTSPAVAFSVGAAGGTGSGALATAVVIPSIPGTANSLFQKSGGAVTINGGLTINSDQGATALATANSAPVSVIEQSASGVGSISTSNGGLNYTVAPTVGFSLPTGINLITNAGSTYAAAPTITVTGGTLVSGAALTSANFTISVNNGTVQSVYLTGGTAVYSTLPTLAFSAGSATLAFPAGCLPTAKANIGTNGQLSSFTINNAGYGYNVAPTVGVGAVSGTATGGTFTTVANTPTARIALYNLTSNLFSPATAAIAQGEDVAIPTNRKINTLSLLSLGLGMNITSDLTLFGTTPLALTASTTGTGNILDLGGKNLIFTLPTYTGTTSTFGLTNAFIRNGSMVLTTRGGSTTLNYPYSGTVTFSTGTGTAVTGGSSATRITVSSTAVPTGTVDSGALAGNRGYRIVRNSGSVYGTNPTVALGYNTSDNIVATNPTIFVAQSAALSGSWIVRSLTTGTGALSLPGSRTTATAAPGPIVMTGDDYFGFSTTLVAYSSAQTGDWATASTWSGGAVPPAATCADVFVLNGHNVTVTTTGNESKSLTVNGTVTVAGGDLKVGCVDNNSALTNNGTLTISGGTINLNGNYAGATGSVFNQSAGNFNIDGNNNGATATSVGSTTPLFQIVTATGTVTGGTLTIIDPPVAAASSRAFQMSFSSGTLQWGAGHTLAFGNGSSTDASANTAGFQFDTYAGSAGTQSMVGSVLIDSGSGTNRWVTTSSVSGNGSFVKGNLTINNGSELRDVTGGGPLVVGGNIVNNGTLSMTSVALSFGTYTGSTLGSATAAQTVSGSGVFRNLLTAPTAKFTNVVINNPFGVTFPAGDVTISNNLTLNGSTVQIVPAGLNYVVGGVVSVAASSTLTFESNANLYQTGTSSNLGNITSKRGTSIKRLDYTYWSSPVVGQNLLALSPNTLPNRFYTYSGTAFVGANPATSTMVPARGYSVRAPNNFSTTAAAFTGSFTGVPNNGTVTLTGAIAGYNLVGNPYPSTVSGNAFLAANPGTLYFWTHFDTDSTGAQAKNNNAMYNLTGTAALTGGATPNGTIQVGQGFMLNKTTAGTITFNNAMRTVNTSTQFFRSAQPTDSEKSRIWLNLLADQTPVTQTLLAYMPTATNGFDVSFDGPQFLTESSALSTMIGADAMGIQARPTFDSSDVVPVGFTAVAAGNYAIAIDRADGLFANNAQDIFLKDNLLGTTTQINSTPYTFVSQAGEFNNRFELRYVASPLSNANNVFNANSVVLFENNNELNINASVEIKAVKIFDIRGRAIFAKNDINANSAVLQGFAPQKQVLMVQIIDHANNLVTKKVIF